MRGAQSVSQPLTLPLPRRCKFDEHALEADASLFVGVDDLVGPRDRCCDVEGQVAVHLSRHVTRYKPQQLQLQRRLRACRTTSATSPRSIKWAWPLCCPSPLSRVASVMRPFATLSTMPTCTPSGRAAATSPRRGLSPSPPKQPQQRLGVATVLNELHPLRVGHQRSASRNGSVSTRCRGPSLSNARPTPPWPISTIPPSNPVNESAGRTAVST